MTPWRVCVSILVLLVGLTVAGCCSSSKEKVVVPTQSTTPTLGKELEDLEEAYKKGAITKEEYEAGKKKLLERGPQGSQPPK